MTTAIVTIYSACVIGSHRLLWRTRKTHEENCHKEMTFPIHATETMNARASLASRLMAGLSCTVGHVRYDPLNFRHGRNNADTSRCTITVQYGSTVVNKDKIALLLDKLHIKLNVN